MSRRTRENPECSAAMLTTLLAAIKHGRRMRTNTESFIRAVELGWFARYQINDLSYDLGLDEGFTEELRIQGLSVMLGNAVGLDCSESPPARHLEPTLECLSRALRQVRDRAAAERGDASIRRQTQCRRSGGAMKGDAE